MKQRLALTALVVKDYDEAIDFYVDVLGFSKKHDTLLSNPADPADPASPDADKRWVVVAPPGSEESGLLLAKADGEQQIARIGDQTGGRVFLFLHTDDFWRDYEAYKAKGVEFVGGEPREESYGTVAVFRDLYGNQWDLIQPAFQAV